MCGCVCMGVGVCVCGVGGVGSEPLQGWGRPFPGGAKAHLGLARRFPAHLPWVRERSNGRGVGEGAAQGEGLARHFPAHLPWGARVGSYEGDIIVWVIGYGKQELEYMIWVRMRVIG